MLKTSPSKLFSSFAALLILGTLYVPASSEAADTDAKQSAKAQGKKSPSQKAAGSKSSANAAEEAAQQEASQEPPKPWEEGVSLEDQTRARALFKEGTALLNDASFGPASLKLDEALSIWGHPAIHYNMAMAQVQLDRPLEARKHLLAATAFGAEAIGAQNFDSAKTYIKLVEKQLTFAKISADIDGVEVSLDGQPLFSSPKAFSDYLTSGTHAIVARKEGYLTSELSENFEPGSEKTLAIKLYTADELTEYRRRWPVWMPWTVLGAGAAVTVVGGILHGVGHSKVSDFDSHAKANGLLGIVTTNEDRDLRRSGINMQKGGVAMYAVGGSAIAAGVVFLVLNKATPYLFGKPVEEGQTATGSVATPAAAAPPAASAAIVPVISPDGAGLAATGTF